ncbi:hypothetical protein [Nitrospirillum viridazoti]|uniref:Uncharacterized protein n=1 Tax=Nitrospirillum viridazoti CBAmc TaxID=1441467 RepID=A0A248JYL7_9PROT|nr:hypothetical protein [Nitrospirillum amazonense]ASG23304.1 hypothetical protein Y958_20995 [Nitrospirillum amazonense CBAmc]TWB40032.1 hypothetical protein FBZ91_105267 [Nitrospirillum amazonense]
MLSLITAPFRLLFRLVGFLILMAVVLVVVFPYAVDLPGWAQTVMARVSDDPASGVVVRAEPEVQRGVIARLVLHDLSLANPLTPDRPSITAARAVVEVDPLASLTSGRLVLRTQILDPVIYADRPINLRGLLAGVDRTLGGAGVSNSVSLVGGSVRLSGKGADTGIDLGAVTVEAAPRADYAGTGRGPS